MNGKVAKAVVAWMAPISRKIRAPLTKALEDPGILRSVITAQSLGQSPCGVRPRFVPLQMVTAQRVVQQVMLVWVAAAAIHLVKSL